MTFWLAGLLILASAFGARASSAAVSYKQECLDVLGGPACSLTIDISGDIDDSTPVKVSKWLERWSKDFALNVDVNSNGGSIDAAMTLGRMLRTRYANVIVPAGAECTSACVFLLVGAVFRSINGRVGIHRPYFSGITGEEPTISDTKTAIGSMEKKIGSYLSEMNVPNGLLDEMMVVPPDQIRYLTPDDLAHFGLSITDPVWSETSALREARKYGLDRVEYVRRLGQAKITCRSYSWEEASRCFDDVLFGRRH
jgi:hypothetical protein